MRLLVVGIVAAMVLSGGNAKADFTFGTPKNLGMPINSVADEYSHCISADGLELYLSSTREGGLGSYDLWVSTRPTVESEWGSPANMGAGINSSNSEIGPALSYDGLELYFQSSTGSMGNLDIWVVKRVTKDAPWGERVNLGAPVNSIDFEYNPTISSDGLELYFAFGPDGDQLEPRLAVTTRETIGGPWGVPVDLGPEINNWPCQDTPWISSDGLVLMFTDCWWSEPRPGGLGETDIWFTRRSSKEAEWTTPLNLGNPINSAFNEDFPMISSDGSSLYFSSSRFNFINYDYDIYMAPILPVVDFDSDGVVAINDLLMLIESLGTDDPKCDIGPMPWGDGVVDEADVEVLMKYWGKDVNALPAPMPMAHWKLDESEGTVAYDSVGTNDANLVGDPLWQPAGGWVDGALELDGVDDGAEAGFLFNPVKTPFSAFAWIKGGGPDQVIVSQAKGEFGRGKNWLSIDSMGNLKSEFIWITIGVWDSGPDLFSSALINDGQWHHVGFVWDSYNVSRILYVDGIEVAKDTMKEDSFVYVEDGGINIGFQASILHRLGYWSGLIDDVRIYDRALSAEQVAELVQ
jgi:hypothetical protein